jgi:hypothetical protein
MHYRPRNKPIEELLALSGFTYTGWGWEKLREQYFKEGIIKKKYGKVFRVHCFVGTEGTARCHADKTEKTMMFGRYSGGKHLSEHRHFLLNDQKEQFKRLDTPD